MRVGILGSGDVGQVLGAAFATLGYDVKLGTRDPASEKIKAWRALAGPQASAGKFDEAAGFGELLVLATAWSGTEAAIRLAGADHTAGKVVIDATNPLDFSGGSPKLAVSGNDSGGERVQGWLPKARVVKAFNMIGNAHMFRPQFPGGPPTMFYAGNDGAAKTQVAKILADFGWESIDLGGIESARYLEPLAMVWILHSMGSQSPNHALKLLHK